jgi:ubiquinone biosynthesis protein UbiJ
VLSDYPAARAQLQGHEGKLIAADVGPFKARMRVTRAGEMELVGETGSELSVPDVSFVIPLSALPKLASKDAAAFSQIVFTGDSELAATLSDIARNIEWDIEEDLSRVLGDVAAHRIVDTVERAHVWRKDAGQRFTANVAEYLTEERRSFISQHDLDDLTRHNEALRDDIARLDARLAKFAIHA